MISSISRRLPRKTCGLFDTGFAGDDLDVASLDFSAPADIDQSLFAFEGVDSNPSAKTLFEGSTGLSTADHDDALKVDAFQASGLMGNWNYDSMMEEPLAGLDDPLADDSLDAFVNLDSFFMEDSFFDNTSLLTSSSEPAEVKPVIDIAAPGSSVYFQPVLPAATPQTASKPQSKSSRKRKLQATTTTAPVETSLFKIPEVKEVSMVTLTTLAPQVDHDYTVKCQRMSSACEVADVTSVSSSKVAKKSTPKRKRNISTASDDSVVSSTSTIDIEGIDEPENNRLDKQTVRRIKNNVASKRSREQRKQKFADMDLEAEELIVKNEHLRSKIVELEKLAKEMKEQLVAKMAGK